MAETPGRRRIREDGRTPTDVGSPSLAPSETLCEAPVGGGCPEGEYIRAELAKVVRRDMGMSGTPGLIPELTHRPTSVFLHGSNRALLNWVMFVMLASSDPGYFWTDVRLPEEVLDPLDPLARGVVPPNQLSVILPEDLRPSPVPGDAMTSMLDRDETSDSLRRVAGFLRLPAHTQELISRKAQVGRVTVFGLSNAHRTAALYRGDAVRTTIRAIHESGVSLIMTWGDALPGGSRVFDFVVEVEGSHPAAWKDAHLRCLLGDSVGPLRAGARLRLSSLPAAVERMKSLDSTVS